jgi:hypothetical protein
MEAIFAGFTVVFAGEVLKIRGLLRIALDWLFGFGREISQ